VADRTAGTFTAGTFTAAIAASVVVTLVRAAVIAHLWQWYVADTFGAPRIGVAEAAGLLLLLMFAAVYLDKGEAERADLTARDVAQRAATSCGLAGLSLLLGLALAGFR
jgi:hypothetical protein